MSKYVLPGLAVLGLGFAIFNVVNGAKPPKDATIYLEPPSRPEKVKSIAGAGLIEARQENIPIGANIPGVVTKMYVKIGDPVKVGTPLFRTDDRNLKAELKVREANLLYARAQLERLKASPQTQDIPTAQAAVDEARARLFDSEIIYKRTSQLFNQQVSPSSEFDRDRYAFQAAKAALARSEAELARIRTTWQKDIEVAQTQVEQAQSQVAMVNSDLDRCTVQSFVDGEVLQVNVRLGQFAAAVWKEPLLVLGDVKTLNVRVDIDEQDVPFFDKDAEAVATLKGRPGYKFALKEIVKIEPYVIPKKSLTGDNSERVDTRVLQVVYALPRETDIPLYVGEQMDVYLKAATLTEEQEGRLKAGPGVQKPFDDSPKDASPTRAK